MLYQVIPTPHFQKDVKNYRKRFKNVTKDLDKIIGKLALGDLVGDKVKNVKVVDANGQAFKVRVANSDTHTGKSNGYRVIYYAVKEDGKIFLLTVYYKKDKENITAKEIEQIVKENCLEEN